MKHLIILDHDFNRKDIVETDFTPKVFDCIVPQKTTIALGLGLNVEDNDIVIIRDGETKREEFIGLIETTNKSKILQLQVEPFISICDNDCLIDSLDGQINIQDWIINQITKNFINTDDVYNKYNIVFRNNTNENIIYKSVSDSSNLLDVLNEIYLNTGIYIEFSSMYENGRITGVYCDIYNANEQTIKKIRYDNPQITGEISYKFSQYGNYTKASIFVEATNKTYYFYLREDNKITTNPKDELRLKKVKNKNIKMSAEVESAEQLAEALVVLAQKELCGDAFAYSIEFKILRRAISDWKYKQRCDFKSENKLYESYITNIEYLNDKEAKVTLGAYRYTLTDKFKSLLRPKEELGKSFNGISISSALGDTTYWFTQENGDLILNYTDGDNQPNFSINSEGELIYTYDENNRAEPDFQIESSGDLIYKY